MPRQKFKSARTLEHFRSIPVHAADGSEAVGAVRCGSGLEHFLDGFIQFLRRARSRFAQQRLQLGKDVPDRIEAGRAGRQEPQLGFGSLNGFARVLDLAGAGVVHDHDAARAQGRHRKPFEMEKECVAADRAIGHARRRHAAGPGPHRADECGGSP